MNKKEQDKWMAERIEQWRAEVEAEKLVFLSLRWTHAAK